MQLRAVVRERSQETLTPPLTTPKFIPLMGSSSCSDVPTTHSSPILKPQPSSTPKHWVTYLRSLLLPFSLVCVGSSPTRIAMPPLVPRPSYTGDVRLSWLLLLLAVSMEIVATTLLKGEGHTWDDGLL